MWHLLPLSLREIVCPGTFKNALINHIWKVDIMSEYQYCVEEKGIEPSLEPLTVQETILTS